MERLQIWILAQQEFMASAHAYAYSSGELVKREKKNSHATNYYFQHWMCLTLPKIDAARGQSFCLLKKCNKNAGWLKHWHAFFHSQYSLTLQFVYILQSSVTSVYLLSRNKNKPFVASSSKLLEDRRRRAWATGWSSLRRYFVTGSWRHPLNFALFLYNRPKTLTSELSGNPQLLYPTFTCAAVTLAIKYFITLVSCVSCKSYDGFFYDVHLWF